MSLPHSLFRFNCLPLYEDPHSAVHLSVHEHLGCVHLLAAVSRAAVKMSVPGCLCTPVFYSPECIPGSEIPGSDGSSFGKLPDCFSQWLYHFTFPSAVNKSSCGPTPRQHLVLSVLWILAVLKGVLY